MTHLVLAPEAEYDLAAILTHLRREAGPLVAEKYRLRMAQSIRRLCLFPESGAPRAVFGETMRMAIVYPYLLFYEYRPDDDQVILLRILHGKSDLEDELPSPLAHSP